MPYPPETIGSIMSSAIPTCARRDMLEEIFRILSREQWDSVRNVYVVDARRKLLGVIDMATLIQADHAARAEALMRPCDVYAHPEADQETAVFLAVREDVTNIPVVDHEERLLGSVTARAIMDIMHDEHIEDALLTAGIRHSRGAQIVKLATERTSLIVRSRAPWLIIGLAAGLGLGFISSLFERQLQETVALAYFIPVVAYIADSIGTQTEAIAVRALATVRINYWRYLAKELFVGMALGVLVGVLGGAGGALISQSVDIGFVVALSLFCASTIAAVIAALIPIAFKAAGRDPALGSGPLATAIQDIVSVLIYFAFAVALL